MSRTARLLAIMQSLRRRRRPVPADDLAREAGVSTRTIYRDIETLVEQGAAIRGDPGLGFTLAPGYFLPPLSFSSDELDAVFLGLALVGRRDDEELARAAADAAAKIAAVLPAPEQHGDRGLVAGPSPQRGSPLTAIRHAIRAEQALKLRYIDKKGATSDRVVWPVAVGFFDTAEVLAAWCEMRRGFRHFRLDRINSAAPAGHGFGKRRAVLMAEWEAARDVAS